MGCKVECSFQVEAVSPVGCESDLTLPVIPPEDELDGITPLDVTEEAITGAGVFDVYMRAGMAQLDTQWTKGRIKGADYAKAYIANTQLMMTQANQFVIAEFEAEMKAKMFGYQLAAIKYDALIKESQAKESQAKVDLLCQQIAELKANGAVERSLKQSQIQTQAKQAELYDRQIQGYNEKNANDNAKTLFDAWAVQAVEEPDPLTYMVGPLTVGGGLDNFARKVKSNGGF